MKTALEYLEAALHTGYQEIQALNAEAFDKVDELAKRRSELLAQAWALRHTCDTASYKEKLLTLHKVQERLIQISEKQRQDVRKNVSHTKKESRRLAGYKRALNYK